MNALMKINLALISAAFLAFTVSCGKESPVDPSDDGQTTIITEDIAGRLVSIQEFGVLPSNSPATNKANLQKAIDKACEEGLALYVTPVENGYPMDGGLVLRRNVSLIGAHGPTGRGTANKDRSGPTGSLFVIKDKSNVFITVESASQIRGIQFYYPEQSWIDPAGIIPYPPTIQTSHENSVHGVSLRDLSFYGEYMAMDFRAPENVACEQILFENCYGYPLSGEFIAIDRCYDIPRILHCHVNPANMREFRRDFSGQIMAAVTARKKYTYWIDRTDNAVLMDIFTFGNYGGIYLGPTTYGQLTSFNFDCVTIGVYHSGDGGMNRTWQISQGSIIANLGDHLTEIHPVVVDGLRSHTTLTAVECFSGMNGIPCCIGASHDFIYVAGNQPLTVTLVGCRMWGYAAKDPISMSNPNASLRAVACTDKNDVLFDRTVSPGTPPKSGEVTSFDPCDYVNGWWSALGQVAVDVENRKEGACCQSVTGSKGDVLLSRSYRTPVNVRATPEKAHLCLWFYLSDVNALDLSQPGMLEITSSGTCDADESAWPLSGMGLHDGWNFLDLKLSDATATGTIDLTHVNYLRIYHLGLKSELTVKIDDVYFYEE